MVNTNELCAHLVKLVGEVPVTMLPKLMLDRCSGKWCYCDGNDYIELSAHGDEVKTSVDVEEIINAVWRRDDSSLKKFVGEYNAHIAKLVAADKKVVEELNKPETIGMDVTKTGPVTDSDVE